MSAPAEKVLPAPVSTITRTDAVSLSSSKAAMNSSTNSLVCAFTGGASIVTSAMWSLISVLIRLLSIGPPAAEAAFAFDKFQAQLFGLSQRGIEIDGALQIEADVAFIGVAHGPMQMHRAPADRERGIACPRLCRQYGKLCSIVVVRLQ